MRVVKDNFVKRAAAKGQSRERDESRLQQGLVSRDQLARENSFLDHDNIKQAKVLGRRRMAASQK